MDHGLEMLRGKRPSTSHQCRCRRRSDRSFRMRPSTLRMCLARQATASAESMDWSPSRARQVQRATCREYRTERVLALRTVQHAEASPERSAMVAGLDQKTTLSDSLARASWKALEAPEV